MAIDEALLDAIDGPVLRVYRWARPAVSFGYFERWKPVQAAHPDREAVRRWTGGGVVLHGDDFTYSLLLPPGGVPIMEGAAGSYKIIHHALCQALQDIKINAEPAPTSAEKLSQACFENPVRYDVLVDGRKVAGAAQRRARTVGRAASAALAAISAATRAAARNWGDWVRSSASRSRPASISA